MTKTTSTVRKTPAAANAASIEAIRAATKSIPTTAKVVGTKPKAKKSATQRTNVGSDGLSDQDRAAMREQADANYASQPTESSYFEQFSNMFSDFKMPSGRRMLCSIVAQLFVLASGLYSGMQVAALLGVGAMVLTGSAFLSFLGWFVGMGLALYASLIAGARVARYIALGEIDNDAKRAKAWFSSKWSGLKERFASDSDEAASA